MALPVPQVELPGCQQNWEAIAALLFSGTGTPEGRVRARVGSLYLRRDGGAATTLYVKESGTDVTGWVAK